MSGTRTIWEQGREPGHQVVALALALALSAVVLDLALLERVSALFDLCFVALCVVVALRVRRTDFFAVGVLPPLVMVAVFLLLAVTRPAALAHPDDGVVQAVVTGLSRHSLALVAGYLLCLGVLAVRHHRATSPSATPRAAARP